MLLLVGVAYVVDLEISRGVPLDVLLLGLRRMGWGEIVVDDSSGGEVVRFVGRPLRAIEAVDTDLVRWARVEAPPTAGERDGHGIDFFGEPRLRLFPFRLKRDHLYALHLMMRNADLRGSGQTGRASVIERLERMGFDLSDSAGPFVRLSGRADRRTRGPIEVRKNQRLPDKPNASVSLWYAVGRWRRAESYVNGDDPFYFESVAEVTEVRADEQISGPADPPSWDMLGS